ncbi:SusC/RagA family TonB-linked outer membrane protein [Foetidibacter luteolus]|uniref:SusC/RagA family TonB-linked outer membrane protein n=1 Tax=Foetidibacter luteolus TaxID=2608880 RepID=UPI00129B214B|nr:SusC/RagA family TonB-linked outer membrane protein [Foetidibacter luteolus]
MRKIVSVLMMLMLFSLSSLAQSRDIPGKIVSSKGDPVPFASVKISGTSSGVVTDATGSFLIKAKAGDVLEISSVGYLPKKVTVGTEVNLAITLEVSNDLAEVVVTGAYNTKATGRSVSYNAQVVTGEKLNTIRQTNLNNALAGKVSGLQVRSQSAAALGRQGSVRLRGAGGFGGSEDIIYVVDGTILPNIDGVNMDDVEDVTVLQGPAASAQFGSQGANGAIVITLKRGKKNFSGIGVDVNTGAQWDNVYILPNYQNSYAGGNVSDMYKYTWQAGHPEEWKALDGKYYHDYSDDASWGPRMVGQEYIPWYSWYPGSRHSYTTARLVPQPDNARDFYNTALTLNNTVSFSKATDMMNLRVSYGNISVNGLIPTSSLRKSTFNLNSTIDLNQHFTVGANVNYISSKINGQVEDDGYSNQSTGSFNQWFHRNLDMNIMKELRGLRTADYGGIYASWNHANPTSYDPNNPRGFYAGNYWYNFYTWFDLVKQTTAYERLYGDVSLTYKLNNDLRIRGTYRKQQNTAWTEQMYSSDLNNSGLQTTGNTPEARGYYSTGQSYSNRENIEFLVSYSKRIKDFQVNANAGSDFFRWTSKSNGGNTNNGLNVPNLFTLANSKDPASIANYRQVEKYNALYFLSNVGYKNLIFADITLRNDWYSTLPSNNNDVFSKSFGVSFIFSDLTKNAIPWLSYGKVRAAWGEIPRALGTTSTTFGAYRYPSPVYGLGQFQWNGNFLMNTPDQLVDSALTGAVKTQKEIGLELRFLKNRFGFSVTYWDGTEKNLPYSVTTNGATGFTSKLLNTGQINKKGIDVQFNAKPLQLKNFAWEINATWGYLLDNKVVSIAPGLTDRTTSIDAVWGTTMPYLVHQAGMQWGQIFGNGIKRINGQPQITDAGAYVNDPSVYFGSVLPQYTGGVQNSFYILKNFIVNVNLDYQVGGKFVSLSDMWGSYSGLTKRTATINDKGNPIRDAVADGGGVHVFGVDADGKPKDVYVEAQDYFHGLYNNKTFDPYIYDLTFLKLREVSFGYDIPVKKIGFDKVVNKAVFSLVARNPWLIYAKTKDFDPAEISAETGESGQFPGTRGWGFNLRVSF